MLSLVNQNLIKCKSSQTFIVNYYLKKYLQRCQPIRSNSTKSDSTSVTFSNGRTLRISSGQLARMADGCAVVSAGDTNVMVVAVSKQKSNSSYSTFVPLTVDYRHKYSAAGRIPTNHLRREMGANEREILTARVIDRSVRPQFPKGFNCETQLVCNLMSVDAINSPDILALNGASAALALSDIPWNGPIGAVRVALMPNHEVVALPTRKESTEALLNCIMAINETGNIVMLEAFANQPVEDSLLRKALAKALKESKLIINGIKTLQNSAAKPKRDFIEPVLNNSEEYYSAVKESLEERVKEVFTDYSHDKFSRDKALSDITTEVMAQMKEKFGPENESLLSDTFYNCLKNIYSEVVFKTQKRCDGRLESEVRPISCSIDLYKPLHGSALFQRGQTQVFCSLTFDSLDSVWKSDPFSVLTGGIKEKNFMLHYEFPQYATNAIGRSGIGRREIGHGALAERAIRPVVPDDHPFTIRLNCEVLESNGSSSMASVCAGSLALMDAGVNISAPTAGVAMGLIKHQNEFKILTDIMGMEDHFGEMDFKIAGTKKAFTALQLDCKLEDGLPFNVLLEAIHKASVAKNEIINIMNTTIRESRKESKANRPVSQTVDIPVTKRSKVLGFGGYNVKKLTQDSGVHLTQDEEDISRFTVFAPNQSAMDEALVTINRLMDAQNEPILEFGTIYTAKVVEIRENGVLVQLYPEMSPAFIHVSQLDIKKVSHPSALDIEIGNEIEVKYFGRDPVSGIMRLSRKVIQSTETFKRNLIEEKH